MSNGFVKATDGAEIYHKDWGPKSAQCCGPRFTKRLRPRCSCPSTAIEKVRDTLLCQKIDDQLGRG